MLSPQKSPYKAAPEAGERGWRAEQTGSPAWLPGSPALLAASRPGTAPGQRLLLLQHLSPVGAQDLGKAAACQEEKHSCSAGLGCPRDL